MAVRSLRLTRLGKIALAKALTGKELKFIFVKIGDGDFDYDTESVFDVEDLRQYRMTLPLTSVKQLGDGTVYVKAKLSNAEVYDEFCAKEHGLYVQDPDTGEEILYGYKNDGEAYTFVPSNVGPAIMDIEVEYVIEISDAENVTAVIDLSVAYINTADFQEHIDAAHPHPNTPNHYDDVADADAIWVTDHDNHLHKMSVNNFKTQLREEVSETAEKTLSEEEIVARAKAELGLDANMLIVEDFKNPDTLDNFKIRVTSSAENGLLLGVESIDSLTTGSLYIISDGVNQEVVKVSSVVYNISGIHVRLSERLTYAYDWGSTYLYRTAYSGSEKAALIWTPDAGFGGVSANIARTITLNTSVDKANDFDIEGNGYLTVDGYFTLGMN